VRKPRDIDAELKALGERQKQLKAQRVLQLGELVEATGAAGLDLEALTGALLAAAVSDAQTREAWRGEGVAFFRARRRGARAAVASDGAGAAAHLGGGAAG
jgi:DNA-binding protein H-NS